ncbi:hypothetical protein ROHU_026866 [Labeo rohita]|uniref:Uncharacterized protein n=1 Tax=Labeo rohita TaxID=84645 RepID=A0A498MF13_LABRO|nr:hypothetical protein ROHU_026866 [Labeo rohita]
MKEKAGEKKCVTGEQGFLSAGRSRCVANGEEEEAGSTREEDRERGASIIKNVILPLLNISRELQAEALQNPAKKRRGKPNCEWAENSKDSSYDLRGKAESCQEYKECRMTAAALTNPTLKASACLHGGKMDCLCEIKTPVS